jgi:hypothetical protein
MDQDTENLKDKRVRIILLLEALKAGNNALRLEEQITYWCMKYPMLPSFGISEFMINIHEYIKYLAYEYEEDRSFLDHVTRKYCTDQSKCGEVEEVPENTSKWN